MAPVSSMPARMRTGSLGNRRNNEKMIRLTRINVGIMLRKRRMRYFRTGSLLPYFFTQKSPGRMCPSPRKGFSSQPPVVGMWQPM